MRGQAFAEIGYQLHAMDYFDQALALCQEMGKTTHEYMQLHPREFCEIAMSCICVSVLSACALRALRTCVQGCISEYV